MHDAYRVCLIVLKEILNGVRLESYELKTTFNTWLKDTTANYYYEGIQQILNHRYDKCLNLFDTDIKSKYLIS